MKTEEFKKLLKEGQYYEKLAEKLLIFDKIIYPEGKCSTHDFYIVKNKKRIYYEVKSDKLAHKTNNFAIEVESNKIPSGLSVTKAKYYIYFVLFNDTYDVYIIPVKKLKKDIIEARKIYGGYNKLSLMALLNINNYIEYKYNGDKPL